MNDVQSWIRDLKRFLPEQLHKIRVAASDESPGYLTEKLVAGSNVTLTTGSDAITIAAAGGSFAPIDAQYHVVALNGTLTNERVDVYQPDDFLTVDGGANGNFTIDLKRARLRFYAYSDMWSQNETAWIGSRVTGAGSSTTNAITIAGHPGVITLNSGSSATGRAGMGSEFTPYRVGDCEWTLECDVMLNQLSDGTNTFWCYFGLTTSAAAPANGVLFRYKHDNNGGKWELAAIIASAATVQDSGVAVAASTWYRLTLIINAAGTAVEGFVNGTSIGSVSSGLPATSTSLGIHCFLANTVGTGSRTAELDYMEQVGVFSASR